MGAGWGATCRFTLPLEWPSGLYAVKLKTAHGHRPEDVFHLPFVLRGRKGPGMPSVVVMSNTFTWQAYNPWGGGSFYKGDHPRAPEDSYETVINLQRPNLATARDTPIGHTGYAEKHIHTYAPFQVLEPSHWLFRGAGVAEGDLIGTQGLNEGGASGGEEDKVGPLTPPGAVRLAHGLNPGQGGADIVFFETPRGGRGAFGRVDQLLRQPGGGRGSGDDGDEFPRCLQIDPAS